MTVKDKELKIEELRKELEQAENGYQSDDFTEVKSEKVTCKKHGDYTQYSKETILPTGVKFESVTRCPACIREENKDIVKSLTKHYARKKEIEIKKLYEKSGVTKRFENCCFDNYEPVNQQSQKALRICQAYAEKWKDRLEKGGGLVLLGNCGTGKNHLATSIAKSVIENHQNSVLMTSVTKIIRDFRSVWARYSDRTESEVIKNYLDFDLLIIDEVGVQYGSESEQIILFEVINSRYEDMKPTILISNENRDGLVAYLGERIIDRMKEGGGCEIVFDWTSYRAKTRAK